MPSLSTADRLSIVSRYRRSSCVFSSDSRPSGWRRLRRASPRGPPTVEGAWLAWRCAPVDWRKRSAQKFRIHSLGRRVVGPHHKLFQQRSVLAKKAVSFRFKPCDPFKSPPEFRRSGSYSCRHLPESAFSDRVRNADALDLGEALAGVGEREARSHGLADGLPSQRTVSGVPAVDHFLQ
jgi:hypothetical protein